VAASLVGGAALAQSQTEPPPSVSSSTEARQLFKDGNALFDAGRYEDALPKFEAAYAAWANPKILLNLATTLRALERSAAALQAYQRYSKEAQPSLERKAEVDAICSELLDRVATLRLGATAEGQSVTLDGKPLDAAVPSTLYLEPGEHVLVSASGGGEQALRFAVQPGETRELAPPRPAPVLDRVAETPPSPAEPSTGSHRMAVLARADIDGRGRGVLGAAGLGYTLGASWQLAAGALLGKTLGAWVGLERFVGHGPLQLSLGVSAPTFFSGAAHVGLSLDAGVRWALFEELVFLRGRAAAVHFPSVPDGYSRTVFVPSLGLEWQL
jgi:hypothetical protein